MLDRLRGQGRCTAKVVSNSSEAPAEILAAADLVLAGPAAVVETFSELG